MKNEENCFAMSILRKLNYECEKYMCVDEGVGIYNKNLINLIQLHDSYL
jgi:hypothetical protein